MRKEGRADAAKVRVLKKKKFTSRLQPCSGGATSGRSIGPEASMPTFLHDKPRPYRLRTLMIFCSFVDFLLCYLN